VMLSAATLDSRSVTVDYRIDPAPQVPDKLHFTIYRSADSRLDSGDREVGNWVIKADGLEGTSGRFDNDGHPAAAAGEHQLTIPLSTGLPLDPLKPFVLVVANPSDPTSATDSSHVVSFRKYTIGVVTHGALINPSWKHGPPWQLQTATLLKQQGYDAVIPFNWASQSSRPGHAAKQGSRLMRQILQVAGTFPAGSPVDLHLIGHSEGTVVNTQAIAALNRSLTPELSAGYMVDTLLDPHAANNNVPGQGSAARGLLGFLASSLVAGYQARANDPPVYIPYEVDEAQVFYQHSAGSLHRGIYNLWGQVPVPNFSGRPIAYYNLTAAGVIHSGNFGVSLWYRNFVAPTLSDQAPLIKTIRLDGSIEATSYLAAVVTGPLAQQRGLWTDLLRVFRERPLQGRRSEST
jgi:hypothetical protein